MIVNVRRCYIHLRWSCFCFIQCNKQYVTYYTYHVKEHGWIPWLRFWNPFLGFSHNLFFTNGNERPLIYRTAGSFSAFGSHWTGFRPSPLGIDNVRPLHPIKEPISNSSVIEHYQKYSKILPHFNPGISGFPTFFNLADMFNIASAYFMMWWYAQNVNLVSKNVQLRQCKGGKICSPIFSFVALNFTQGIKGLQKDLRAGIRTTRNQGFWECESWSMCQHWLFLYLVSGQ